MKAYQWLIIYLLDETENKQTKAINAGLDRFTARNESQVYCAALLARVFGEYTALRYYWSHFATAENELKRTLTNLGVLYGLTCLDKHLVYFYQGQYAQGPEMSRNVKEAILELCRELKPDSISIIDGIAPPDYVIHSVLGKSDGKVISFICM